VNGDVSETPSGYIGDLATLLTWNVADDSDDFEMNRNNYIYTWQVNRNPFIDYPELANYIWGANAGQPWFSSLSTSDFTDLNVSVYPNPAENYITIYGLNQESSIEIYTISGMKLMHTNFIGETKLDLDLASGMYLAKITSDNKTVIKKIIIK